MPEKLYVYHCVDFTAQYVYMYICMSGYAYAIGTHLYSVDVCTYVCMYVHVYVCFRA